MLYHKFMPIPCTIKIGNDIIENEKCYDLICYIKLSKLWSNHTRFFKLDDYLKVSRSI